MGKLAATDGVTHARRLVQIVVNAQAKIDFPDFGQRAELPSLEAIAFTISNAADRS